MYSHPPDPSRERVSHVADVTTCPVLLGRQHVINDRSAFPRKHRTFAETASVRSHYSMPSLQVLIHCWAYLGHRFNCNFQAIALRVLVTLVSLWHFSDRRCVCMGDETRADEGEPERSPPSAYLSEAPCPLQSPGKLVSPISVGEAQWHRLWCLQWRRRPLQRVGGLHGSTCCTAALATRRPGRINSRHRELAGKGFRIIGNFSCEHSEEHFRNLFSLYFKQCHLTVVESDRCFFFSLCDKKKKKTIAFLWIELYVSGCLFLT